MIMDAKWRFHVNGAATPPTLANETLPTTTTAEYLSDPIDLIAGGYADGGGDLLVRTHVVATNVTLGSGFTVAVKHCDTNSGTAGDWTVAASSVTPKAGIVAGKELTPIVLPPSLKRWIKLSITGTTSTDGATSFKAGIVTS